jgi:hypothetical protein
MMHDVCGWKAEALMMMLRLAFGRGIYTDAEIETQPVKPVAS